MLGLVRPFRASARELLFLKLASAVSASKVAMAEGLQAKKSLPLSSTTTKAGKYSTSIFQTASMPSSG